MWLYLAFLSAVLLGFYDTFKKESLNGNAVIPVLFLNTLFCSLIFLPLVLLSENSTVLDGGIFKVGDAGGWEVQKWVLLKSIIVLSSWILGYFGMKHLPLSIVGPINATRPVMVLIGAMLLFGERLNMLQWVGVLIAIVSFFMLSRSSKKEGIDFRHNVWILAIVGAAVLGAVSGLYDKFLMNPDGLGLDKLVVQSYYNFYQCGIMAVILLALWYPRRKSETRFQWRWSIIFISIFLCAADFVYLYALSLPDAMVSIISMIRRSSVIVSFTFGALLFKEHNIKSKAIDLALILLSLVFLWLGSR
jgi:drug/metabolite transporter (DMT)-like permease